MEDSVSAPITVSASLVTVVTSAREVCDDFSSLMNEIIKNKQAVRKLKGILPRRELEKEMKNVVKKVIIDIDNR